MRRFGSAQVRAAGTVGGNIANGSPIGDLPPAADRARRDGRTARRNGARVLPLEDFFIAYGKQDRAPGEFVLRLDVPRSAATALSLLQGVQALRRGYFRGHGAFRFDLDGQRIVGARIAYGGMAATPKRAAGAEAALVGADLDDPGDVERRRSPRSGRDFAPLTDMRATAAYRMKVAANLLRKALLEVAGGAAPTRIGALHAAE